MPMPKTSPLSAQTVDRQRWETIRRAFLALVAQQEAADPTSRYTVIVRIVEKQAADTIA